MNVTTVKLETSLRVVRVSEFLSRPIVAGAVEYLHVTLNGCTSVFACLLSMLASVVLI